MNLTVTPAKAGVSGVDALKSDMARGGYTHVMTTEPRGVLYIGGTADIATLRNFETGTYEPLDEDGNVGD